MPKNKDKKRKDKLLSVIVPAYKKEKTIKEDLEDIDNTLREGLPSEYDYEIICVVDGSPDKTEEEAKKVKSKRVKVLSYKKNKGKGHAVRYGMNYSKGELVSYLDAGREIRPTGIMMLMAHMRWYEADIIVGSKKHPASQVDYPLSRRVLSTGYYLMVKTLLGVKVRDTQSGIKIFKREVLEKILDKLEVQGYAMDIEMLALARHFGFAKIYEGPIEIQYQFEDLTHASTLGTIINMFLDTLAVFWRIKVLRYYD